MPANSLIIETFTEYAIGMCFLALKVFTRVYSFGIRRLQLDDVFAVLAMIFWTLVSVIIIYLQRYGSNIADAKTVDSFPDSMVPNLILGSKLAFTNWIWYLSYIWSLKGVLLCLYHKMTAGTPRRRTVYLASAFCAVTYLACLLAHICVCTPITKNWQVRPYPGEKCTLRKDLYVVIAVLNVASDLLVMIIPIPILLKLQIPPARKIILIILFCSGFFVMVSTVLRAYYSIKSINTLTIALGWADRECFVAAIIASLPGIKPLFRNTSWLGSSARSAKQSSGSYGSRSRSRSRVLGSRLGGTAQGVHGGDERTFMDGDKFELLDRQEKVMMDGREESVGGSTLGGGGSGYDGAGGGGGGITVTRELIMENDQYVGRP